MDLPIPTVCLFCMFDYCWPLWTLETCDKVDTPQMNVARDRMKMRGVSQKLMTWRM